MVNDQNKRMTFDLTTVHDQFKGFVFFSTLFVWLWRDFGSSPTAHGQRGGAAGVQWTAARPPGGRLPRSPNPPGGDHQVLTLASAVQGLSARAAASLLTYIKVCKYGSTL